MPKTLKNQEDISRLLRIGDNLYHMRSMKSNSVDLIYLDPPFNKNRIFSRTQIDKKDKKRETSFNDIWRVDDICIAEHALIEKEYKNLYTLISAIHAINGNHWLSYLSYMSIRLLEMKRILKDTGSIYYHCDPTMSHGIKLIMDAIFGKENFRNEIIWSYPASPSATKRDFPKKHDVILRYSKTKNFIFNAKSIEVPYSPQSIKRAKYTARKSTVMSGNEIKLKTGKLPPTVWQDIGQAYRYKVERDIKYPTKKPILLIERIIKASSNEGDMVFDPFCGCATAMVAAEKLHRKWVGIDISPDVEIILRGYFKQNKIKCNFNITKTSKYRITKNQRVIIRVITNKQKRDFLYDKQQGFCNGCGTKYKREDFTEDHLHPRSKGGGDNIDNLHFLCENCNQLKGDKTMAHLYVKLAKQWRKKTPSSTQHSPKQNTLPIIRDSIGRKIIERIVEFRHAHKNR